MSGGKKTTTSSNQTQTATTQLPQWMLDAGQQNYGAAQAYLSSPEATWSADKAAAYANPYQQQVIDRTVARMRGDNDVELQGVGDQAAASKAYGGTRHGVVEAQVRRDQGDRLANYEAGANADAFNEARSAFEADRAAKMSGYGLLTQVLAGTPKNVVTTGTSNGTSTSKQSGSFLDTLMGMGSLAASAAPMFSDRRLKTGISLIERLANGLGVYRFRYLWDTDADDERIGCMADEIEQLLPAALGPIVGGYRTVNYAKVVEALA